MRNASLPTNISYSKMATIRLSTPTSPHSSTNEPSASGFYFANHPYHNTALPKSSTFEVHHLDVKEHIPRPPNSWILFRKATLAQMQVAPESQAKRARQADISRTIAIMWREASYEVKAKYAWLAEVEKLKHTAKYSDYKYKPRRKATKSNGKGRQTRPISSVTCDTQSISPLPQIVTTSSSAIADHINSPPLLPNSFDSHFHLHQPRHPASVAASLNPVYNTYGYPMDLYDALLPDPLADGQLDWFLQQLNNQTLDLHQGQTLQHSPTNPAGSYIESPPSHYDRGGGLYSTLDQSGGRYITNLWMDEM